MADTQLPQTRTYRKWTEEDLRSEALKYSNRKKFQTGSKAAYFKALRDGLLDVICEHMEPRFIWTDESLADLAMKYSSKVEFRKAHPGAHSVAHERGLIPKICAHMQKPFFEKNCVYIWRVRGTDVYKIGVSSSQHILMRVNEVSLKAGFVAELIVYSSITTNTKAVERQLLSLGETIQFENCFNGHTEFRRLTSDQLGQAVKIIVSNSWLN